LQLWVLLQHKIPETTISSALGCHVKTVFVWKKRFQAGGGILGRPRNGRPPTIPPEVNYRLLAFYCQHDPLPGCSRWSIRWAETYLHKHQEILQCTISRSSIHRFLKSNALRPYRNKYFLQICDPQFFPKMEKIIKAYKRAHPYLFCLDECTGLQALERKAPRLPARGDCPEYLEPEYIRHGTVSILSILQVANGQVFTDCIPDHTSSTIISSVKKTIFFNMRNPLNFITFAIITLPIPLRNFVRESLNYVALIYPHSKLSRIAVNGWNPLKKESFFTSFQLMDLGST